MKARAKLPKKRRRILPVEAVRPKCKRPAAGGAAGNAARRGGFGGPAQHHTSSNAARSGGLGSIYNEPAQPHISVQLGSTPLIVDDRGQMTSRPAAGGVGRSPRLYGQATKTGTCR